MMRELVSVEVTTCPFEAALEPNRALINARCSNENVTGRTAAGPAVLGCEEHVARHRRRLRGIDVAERKDLRDLFAPDRLVNLLYNGADLGQLAGWPGHDE